MKTFLRFLTAALSSIIAVGASSQKLPPNYSHSYSCSQRCDGGDVNFELISRITKLPIENKKAGIKEIFHTRTWHGRDEKQNPKVGLLGPTLRIRPGQRVNILVRNEIEKTLSELIGPSPPPLDRYIRYVNKNDPTNGYASMQDYGFEFTGNVAYNTSLIETNNVENIPHDYDNVNLHLHGLTVAPHLFFPQGTKEAEADYITIKPGQCYCYTFDLPKDHPTGTYWYHPHRHGAIAIQAWSGMAGLLLVEGKYEEQLSKYDIKKFIPAVIWDPHFQRLPDNALGVKSKLGTDFFLHDQTSETMVKYFLNGQYQPTIKLIKNELVVVRLLCATTENLAGFRIVDENNHNIAFHLIASDGINYEKPVKRDLMVLSGGQREDFLLRISKPGKYTIVSDGLSTIQFFNTGPDDQILGFIQVSDSIFSSLFKMTPFTQMKFVPGINKPIVASEIKKFRSFIFNVHGDTATAPFPQFSINEEPYDVKRISETLKPGIAEEWLLINPNQAVHPFHIHIFPFIVKSVESSFRKGNPYQDAQTDGSIGVWRDTVIIPPFSFVRIWIRIHDSLGTLSGKSVYHCHFEAHSDTGMIANMMVED